MPLPLHPEMDALIAQRAASSPQENDVASRRKAWNSFSEQLRQGSVTDVGVEDKTIDCRDGPVAVRIYRPRGSEAMPAPCTVYFHGGGFVLGDLDSSDFVAAGIAEQTGCIVVSIDYPLAPENPFPAPFDASYGCVEWLSRNGEAWGIDVDRIALAGDSAGGNLACAVCIAARDRAGPKIVAQALAYPWISADMSLPARIEFASGYGLTAVGLEWYASHYIDSDVHRQAPYAFPLNATNFKNLPPSWVHIAQCDPVRDDGRLFAQRVIADGGQVSFREAPRTVHAFLRAGFLGPAAAREFRLFTSFLKRQLMSEDSHESY